MAHAPRSSEMRSSAPRPSVGSAPVGRLSLDISTLPQNCEYRWIRESTTGEVDRSNMSDAMRRRAFKPVMAADLPAYNDVLLPGETVPETYVRIGGLMLMGREKIYGDEERANERDETENALQSVAKSETLAARMDGKNFQKDEGSGVQVRVDTGSAKGKFADE